jgi:hypothetical protein
LIAIKAIFVRSKQMRVCTINELLLEANVWPENSKMIIGAHSEYIASHKVVPND